MATGILTAINNTNHKRRFEQLEEDDQDIIGSLCRLGSRSSSPKSQMEQEKRIRREIANSNERRRMQSINAGFQSLRTLLPHHEGEKLSKAAILQQTAEYIYQLEQDKTRLLSQNSHLKRNGGADLSPEHEAVALTTSSSNSKRRKADVPLTVTVSSHLTSSCPTSSGSQVESSDEGLGSMSPEPMEVVVDQHGTVVTSHSLHHSSNGGIAVTTEDMLRREMVELRTQLDRERRQRMLLEDEIRTLKDQRFPEHVQEIQMQYHQVKEDHIQRLVGKSASRQESPPPETVIVSDRLLAPCSSILAAAIKVEPKVEVEAEPRVATPVLANTGSPPIIGGITVAPSAVVAIPTPPPSQTQADDMSSQRLYMPSTSRQNLETIVEAIRHLEGDHLFNDDDDEPRQRRSPLQVLSPCAPAGTPEPMHVVHQDAPLELTVTSASHPYTTAAPVRVEYRSLHQPLIQTRPGVIVVKHS